MARVTVEDCLKNVKNRFELVIIAAKRARQLMHGKEARVEWDNDKPTVVALREIALGYTQFNEQEHRHEETPAEQLSNAVSHAAEELNALDKQHVEEKTVSDISTDTSTPSDQE